MAKICRGYANETQKAIVHKSTEYHSFYLRIDKHAKTLPKICPCVIFSFSMHVQSVHSVNNLRIYTRAKISISQNSTEFRAFYGITF